MIMKLIFSMNHQYFLFIELSKGVFGWKCQDDELSLSVSEVNYEIICLSD